MNRQFILLASAFAAVVAQASVLMVGKTDGVKKVGTQEMGDAIVKELDRLV